MRAWLQHALLLAVLGLVGCGHNPDKVPVEERSEGRLNRSGYYIVQPGDSLYSIAWNYGLEYRALASANGLRSPYTIRVGDKLKLRGGQTAAVSGRAGSTSSAGRAAGVPANNTQAWLRPVSGQVVRRYSGSGSGKLHKGIDFQGKIGQPVHAAKAGRVVYAGKGLKAYGLLVIVKHDTRYLSAYAFNNSAQVKEGDQVKQGQQIARMGTRDGKQAILHFEIRRDGKTVDPLALLPGR